MVELFLAEHTERAVNNAEVGGEPDEDSRKKDYRTGLLYERPAALPHGAEDVLYGRPVISGKLHNEGSRIAGEHLCLLEYDSGDYYCRHTDEVCGGRDPRGAAEQSACDHGDERDLCAAGDEGRRHDGHTAVTLVFYRAGSHDSGNAAAGADEHRDEGLAGEAELTEDTVKDECDTRHVAAGLKECEEEEQDEHLGNESEDCADTGNYTVKDKSGEPLRADGVIAVNSERVSDEHRDTGHPHAVIGGIGSGESGVGLFKILNSLKVRDADCGFLLFLRKVVGNPVVVDGHIGLFKGLLILNGDGSLVLAVGGLEALYCIKSGAGLEVVRFGIDRDERVYCVESV